MNDDLKKTVRLQRNAKVGTDEQGHSVWTKPIEPTEFELVSTVMLKKILSSDDEEKKRRVQALAGKGEGVLARDTNSNRFEILTENELEAALRASGDGTTLQRRPADVVLVPRDDNGEGEELSLVTTQALRKILGKDEDELPKGKADRKAAAPKKEGGFDPYNSG